MRRRVLFFLVAGLLLAGGIYAASSKPPAHGVEETTTIGLLQPAGLRKDRCYVVTNALSDDDCVTGGGSIINICCSDGTSYAAIGDGSGAGSYDLNFAGDTGSGVILDGESLGILGGTNGIDTSGSGNDLTITFDKTEVGITNTDPIYPSDWIVPLSGGPTETVFGSTFPRTILTFGNASDQTIYVERELPSGFRTGDAMTLTVNWSTSTAGGAPSACWCVSVSDFAEGAASDPSIEETVCADEAPAAGANHRIETPITLTATNYAGTNGLVLKFYRDVDNGDASCTGTALAANVRFHSGVLSYGKDL